MTILKTNAVDSINLDSLDGCLEGFHTVLQKERLDSNINTVSQLVRYDADAIGIFSRTLTMMVQDVIRRRKPELNADAFLPSRIENLWGLRNIETPYIESAGQVTYGEGTSDISYTSTKIRYEGTKMTIMRAGLYWNQRDLDIDFQQLRSDISHGLSIVQENIKNTYDIFAETYHKDAMFGIPTQGIEGLLTDSRTPDDIYTTFFPYAEDRADLYNWIKNLSRVVSENASRFLRRPNTLLMSEDLMYKLMDIDGTTDVELTAFDLLKRNLRQVGITNMVALPELNKKYLEEFRVFAPNSNKELIKIYNNDESCIRRYVSSIRVFNPILTETEEYKGHIKQVISSVDNYYPLETLNVIYPTTLS